MRISQKVTDFTKTSTDSIIENKNVPGFVFQTFYIVGIRLIT